MRQLALTKPLGGHLKVDAQPVLQELLLALLAAHGPVTLHAQLHLQNLGSRLVEAELAIPAGHHINRSQAEPALHQVFPEPVQIPSDIWQYMIQHRHQQGSATIQSSSVEAHDCPSGKAHAVQTGQNSV